jgi:hypothetical protein
MDAAVSLSRNLSELRIRDLLKKTILSMLLLFGFYLYLRNFVPLVALFKDLVILLAAGLYLLESMISGRIEIPNRFDRVMMVLTGFLLFQIVYSWMMIGDLNAAYYGFRLTFLPFLAYFPLKRAIGRDTRFRNQVQTYILALCVTAAAVCILEFILINFAGVYPEFILKVMAVSPSAAGTRLASFLRPVGLAGTAHLSGIHGLLLVTFFVPWIIEKPSRAGFFMWMFSILGLVGVLSSTSRTAWTALIVVMSVYYLTRIWARQKLNPWILGLFSIFGLWILLSRSNF